MILPVFQLPIDQVSGKLEQQGAKAVALPLKIIEPVDRQGEYILGNIFGKRRIVHTPKSISHQGVTILLVKELNFVATDPGQLKPFLFQLQFHGIDFGRRA